MLSLRHILLTVFILILLPGQLHAAQSTKDVSASDDLKNKARTSVMGGPKATPADPQYVVGHGDILEIQVYGEGSMAVTAPAPSRSDVEGVEVLRGSASGVQVRIDGRISLKHIGDVEAVGMSLTQLADYLKALYSTVFEDPIVTVVLNQSNSQRYTVMGKVANPGIYYLDHPINLVQVVARSGGFTEWANSEMTLVRKEGRKDDKLFKGNTLKFDYDDFLNGVRLERNVLIESGDILIVH